MRKRTWVAAAVLVLLAVPATILLAAFVNGGFESGDYTGWTKTSFLNPGLSGTPPYSGSSIVRNPGGDTNESVIVTGATPESVPDPLLGAGASLRYPKYGTYSARVNSSVPNQHSNSIVQQATVTAADVDPGDGLVHIRFAFAPVLEDPGHSADQQPYFYVGVRNVTRSNALLYESLNFSNEAGVPWKTSGGLLYTDWRINDIAPGNSALAVGDLVEVEVIGAGCSPRGHFGYIYVDAFGRDLPGLSVQKVADRTLVAPGDTLTYTFTYRNGGTAAAGNVIVRETVPAQTTFSSVSRRGRSSATSIE